MLPPTLFMGAGVYFLFGIEGGVGQTLVVRKQQKKKNKQVF